MYNTDVQVLSPLKFMLKSPKLKLDAHSAYSISKSSFLWTAFPRHFWSVCAAGEIFDFKHDQRRTRNIQARNDGQSKPRCVGKIQKKQKESNVSEAK